MAGFFNFNNSAQSGIPPELAGYFDPEGARRAQINDAMMAAGASLLGSSGRQPVGTGFLSSVGNAAMAGKGAAKEAKRDYYQSGLQNFQLAQAAKKQKQDDAEAKRRDEQRQAFDRLVPQMPPELQAFARANPDAAMEVYARRFEQPDPIKNLQAQKLQYEVDEMRRPKPTKYETVAPGSALVDPSGKVVYQNADRAKAPTITKVVQPDGSELAVQWDQDTNAWVPIKAPQGGGVLKQPKKTESQIKGEAILQGVESSIQILDKTYDSLAEKMNSAASSVYGGAVLMSDDARTAKDALSQIAQSYIYALSGAQAPETEVQRVVNSVMPGPLNGPEQIAAKKARIRDMIETIRSRAQGVNSAVPGQGAPKPSGPVDYQDYFK